MACIILKTPFSNNIHNDYEHWFYTSSRDQIAKYDNDSKYETVFIFKWIQAWILKIAASLALISYCSAIKDDFSNVFWKSFLQLIILHDLLFEDVFLFPPHFQYFRWHLKIGSCSIIHAWNGAVWVMWHKIKYGTLTSLYVKLWFQNMKFWLDE